MRTVYFLSLFVFTIFFSCQPKEREKTSKEIIFDLKANASRYRIQTYYDKKAKEDHIYFIDKNNDRVMKFFDMQGKLLEQVPLDAVLALETIQSYKVVSLDTILLHSHLANKLFFINRKGEIWKKVILSPILKDDKGNNFTLLFKQTTEDLSVIANAIFSNNENQGKFANHYDYLRNYAEKKNESPLICKITGLFDAKPKVSWGFYRFYKNFGNSKDWYNDGKEISFANGKLFVHSIFTDTLYQASQDLQIAHKIKIASAYTPVGQGKPFKTDDASLQKMIKNSEMNIVKMTVGCADDVQYDELSEQYYVTILHQVPITTPKEKQGDERPFSVCIFDKNFKKIKEHFFDNRTYENQLITTKKGLFLIKKKTIFSPKNKSKDYEKVTIVPFDFGK